MSGLGKIVLNKSFAEYERISREPIETSGHSLKLEGFERKQ
jgi:hypothetical protein